ncbi:MAG: LCP family protein [bacterium]
MLDPTVASDSHTDSYANPSTPISNSQIGQPPQDFHRKHRWRKYFLYSSAVLITIGAIIGGVLAYKAWVAMHTVVSRHSGVATTALKKKTSIDPAVANLSREGESRVNILLLGVGDASHAGAGLSDTMLLASIDTKLKTVVMIGIPRDLYVPIPGYGYDKINAAHAYGGPELSKTVVGNVLDIPVHYYARMDFTGFKKIVNSMGGVTVDVPTNLYDSEYPCDYDERIACGFSIRSGTQTMNGDLALKYVRCRKGNCGNDFGRSSRQQQVLIGLRQKALGLSTLTNPAKLAQIIDTIGQHARIDMDTEEIQNLAGILQDVNPSDFTSKVIDQETEDLVYSTNIGGASVVIPKLGSGKFKGIQDFAHSLLVDRYIVGEKAKVIIHNQTGDKAAAEQLRDELKVYKYEIGEIVDDTIVSPKTKLIDTIDSSKPYTLKYLSNRLKVDSQTDSTRSSEADIIIELGTDYLNRGL